MWFRFHNDLEPSVISGGGWSGRRRWRGILGRLRARNHGHRTYDQRGECAAFECCHTMLHGIILSGLSWAVYVTVPAVSVKRPFDFLLAGDDRPRQLAGAVVEGATARMNLTFLLKSCQLFSDLNAQELDAVQRVSVRKDFRKGELIFTEGEPSRGFYLVASGAVKIFRVTPAGRERVLHVVEAGESFAEAAMFLDAYPAAAQALSATTAIWVEKNGFKQLLCRHPRLCFKIMGALVRWLAVLRNALTELSLKEVPARFASYVLSLSAVPGQPIQMTVSKTVIAQVIGTSKETLSRLLARLARRRILTYRGNQLRILNRPRLEAIARGEEKL